MNSVRQVPQTQIFGTRFDAITQAQVVDLILGWSSAPKRRTHTVITVNVAILMMMRSNQKLAKAVANADLVVMDGTPLVWASRWLATAVPERVPGVDLMERLLAKGVSHNLRVFLLGTTQQRLDRLVEVIHQRYPGVHIVGARNGYFSVAEYPEVTRQIRDSHADILLVGMPAPLKEIWCEEQRNALETPAVLGVGGSFDVIAGFVPRAPSALQNAGLEWAWRLALEPRKLWKRYLVTNSQFCALLLIDLVKRLLSR